MTKSKYIVIDGIDGGGKSTLFGSLEKRFIPYHQGSGNFIYTREPGGTPLGETLRTLVLFEIMDPFTELCLFNAQRKEVRNMVKGFLEKGLHIISDRSDSASFAYQIRGKELDYLENDFWMLSKQLVPHPTMYIFLDLDPMIAEERRQIREGGIKKGDRFETQGVEFFQRVRNGFREFPTKVSVPCFFVNAEQEKGEVFKQVSAHITNHLSE